MLLKLLSSREYAEIKTFDEFIEVYKTLSLKKRKFNILDTEIFLKLDEMTFNCRNKDILIYKVLYKDMILCMPSYFFKNL